MFYGKKFNAIEKRLANFETFENGVCKVIDGYFKTNKQEEVRYSMDNAVDKFWHFIKSVDERISVFEKAIADGELVSKEWNDEQVLHLQEENENLKAEIAKECEEHQQFCETAKKKVDEQQAIITAQEKEIKELRKTKTNTSKGGKK